jgi:hypothetical protein
MESIVSLVSNEKRHFLIIIFRRDREEEGGWAEKAIIFFISLCRVSGIMSTRIF